VAYIPTKDSDLITWGANYTTLLTGDPTRYGVVAGQAAVIQAEYDDFAAAYTAAVDPSTRTPASVAHKDGTKALFLDDARALAALIRANQGVSNADKTALGLTIPDPIKTPVPPPTSVPNLTILGATPSLHTMTYKDSDTATGKAKPYGCIGLLLYRFIGDTVPVDFDAADPQLIGLYTKSPMAVDIPGGVRGKLATYWAQWITRGSLASHGAGQIGPLNTPQTFVCPSFNPFGLILLPLMGAAWFCLRTLSFIGQRRKSGTIRNRRGADPSMRSNGIPPVITGADFTTPNIVVTYDQPIQLNGIPQYETNTSKVPTAATQTGDNTISLAYDTPGVVTSITIPANDQAVHSRTGGVVQAGTFPTT
jgi:hypothetical protein